MVKTVEQIAKALNLSVTTVRLVLNNKTEQYRISKSTQSRINEYVIKHGYTINHTAKSLKTNKTDTLGLIVPRLSNVFFSMLAEKLEIRCREAGYQLMISCTYGDPKHEIKLVNALLARNIDGLFIVPSSRSSQQLHIKRLTKPMVVLDRDFGTPDVSLVVSDNRHGSAILTEAMLKAGRTPLFFIVGNATQPAIKERVCGYESTLSLHGIASPRQWILQTPHNNKINGESSMRLLLDKNASLPPSFISSSIPVLEGALSVIRNRFGSIPPEINIGTFDEHPMLSFLSNNVWSVQQNESSWAEMAFNAMLYALQGGTIPQRVTIPMTLLYRQRTLGV